MDTARRRLMTVGLGAGLTATAGQALAGRQTHSADLNLYGNWVDLPVNTTADLSDKLQKIIDEHAANGVPVLLPPGQLRVANLKLRSGTHLVGANGLTILAYAGGDTFVTASTANDIELRGITFDGNNLAIDARRTTGLLAFNNCRNVVLHSCAVKNSLLNGVALDNSSGRLVENLICNMGEAAIFANDSQGLDIVHNEILDCRNNGIQIWRTRSGHDGSTVRANRIHKIAASNGGSGQYGNGINVFRADDVSASDNHIEDCAYSAIRGNAASNLQMTGNRCNRIGEVALYSEFEFEGTMISNNVVTNAASGISVTNFNRGGRLATVTGNLIRNLNRREYEPVDKRGIGISVEADSLVTNNVIENAPSAGIALGWGAYRRDLIAAQNIIRDAKVAILVSADAEAGPTLITNNMISGSTSGGVRLAHLDQPIGPDLVNGNTTTHAMTITQNIVSDTTG